MPPNRLSSRRLGLAAIAAVVSLLILPSAAYAHAELVSSSPGADATVSAPLDEVRLVFTEALAARSQFVVRIPGEVVARGRIDPDAPDQLVASTSGLEPGTYEVAWSAYASDGHLERGRFSFTIEAATATPSPTASPAPTASEPPSGSPSVSPSASAAPTLTPVPVPSPTPDPGPAVASGSDVVVPIIATLLVVGVLGLWLLRRQRRV